MKRIIVLAALLAAVSALAQTPTPTPTATVTPTVTATPTRGVQQYVVPGDMVYRGAWSASAGYYSQNVVVDAGSAYVCIRPHTNHEPPNGSYWTAMGGTGGGMTWPSGAGIAVYSGSSSWGTSLADPLTESHGGLGASVSCCSGIGAILYASTSSAYSALAGPTANAQYVLTSQGNGTVAAPPAWTLVSAIITNKDAVVAGSITATTIRDYYGTPTVTPQTASTQSWTYVVVPIQADGAHGTYSNDGTTTTGALNLTQANSANVVTWPAATGGVYAYDVYRKSVPAGSPVPSTTGKIATVLASGALSLTDNGLVGSGSIPPYSNMTGMIRLDGTDSLCLLNPGASNKLQFVLCSNFSDTPVEAYGYIANGTAGLTTVVTVRDSGGSANCTMTYTGGILTATTCSHT